MTGLIRKDLQGDGIRSVVGQIPEATEGPRRLLPKVMTFLDLNSLKCTQNAVSKNRL